jgi:hypothetical protein
MIWINNYPKAWAQVIFKMGYCTMIGQFKVYTRLLLWRFSKKNSLQLATLPVEWMKAVLCEMNILSLVSQNLDNFYQIQTKWYRNSDTVFFSPIHRTKRGPTLACPKNIAQEKTRHNHYPLASYTATENHSPNPNIGSSCAVVTN